jgi:hypothetical protein
VGESDADRLHLDLDDGTAESLAPDRKLIPLGQIVGRKPQDSPLSCKATLSCKAAFRHPDDLKIRVQNASRLYLGWAEQARSEIASQRKRASDNETGPSKPFAFGRDDMAGCMPNVSLA